jgi:linoleoyl-CoA desaturase
LAFPFSLWAQNIHYSGFIDLLKGSDSEKSMFLTGKTREDLLQAVKNFGKGFVPYFLYNYVFFPAFAGPFFWKVVAGNFCSELICNTWMAGVNLGNHLGGDTELLLPDEEPKDRKQHLLKTIRCCNDFPLSRVVEFHTGGLNYHLAHHLAPKLPPNRLKKLTSQIKELCMEYKVTYNEKGLTRSALSSLGKILYYALPLSKKRL